MKLDDRITDSDRIIIYSTVKSDYKYYKEFVYDNFHNLNGPTLICASGKLEYWINGNYIGSNLSNKEFQQKVKETIFK